MIGFPGGYEGGGHQCRVTLTTRFQNAAKHLALTCGFTQPLCWLHDHLESRIHSSTPFRLWFMVALPGTVSSETPTNARFLMISGTKAVGGNKTHFGNSRSNKNDLYMTIYY